MIGLSFKRLRSLLHKEWIQVRRDPLTLRLIIAMPIMQLLLFGYAINTNPKHLPTGVLAAEHSNYERTLVAALQNSGYYDVRSLPSEQAAEEGARRRRAAFRRQLPPQLRPFGRPRRIPVRAHRRRRHRSDRYRLRHGRACGHRVRRLIGICRRYDARSRSRRRSSSRCTPAIIRNSSQCSASCRA